MLEGLETFVKHVGYVRQQSAPRLVDLGTLNEEDMIVAKWSLISVSDMVKLCQVVSIIGRASLWPNFERFFMCAQGANTCASFCCDLFHLLM